MQIDPSSLCHLPTPWDTPGACVLSTLNRQIGCTGIQLEVMADAARQQHAPFWRTACGDTTKCNRSKRGHSVNTSRYIHQDRLGSWVFTANSGREKFSDAQQKILDLVLLRWHNDFMSGPSVEGGHVLLDANQRLITADLKTQTWLVGQPQALVGLFEQVTKVTQERFESLRPDQPAEMILDYSGQLVWIKLTASSSDSDAPGGYYGEIRLVPKGEVPVFSHIEDHRVARVLGFLDTRYNENPDLKVLAKSVGLSIYHLHRLFSEHINISPKQYLLCRQLQVAKWLLRATSLPVSEVADLTGFSSSGHFSTTFNRMAGMKPVHYRDRAE